MNLLVINQPLNNRGDEAAHKGLLRTLAKEFPEAEIKVLFVGCSLPSIQPFMVKDERIEYINLKPVTFWEKVATVGLMTTPYLWFFHPTLLRIMYYYRKTDWVVCAPGGICMGGFQNWIHLFFLKLAQFMGKKLAYYGRSFGPFPTETTLNRLFKKRSIEILHYFSFLAVRDKKSESLAEQLNVNYISTVDSAFLDTPKVEIPDDIKKRIADSQYMVFVPNLLIWHYAYKNRISKDAVLLFFSQLSDSIKCKFPSYKQVMLPQTFCIENPEKGDITLFREIVQNVGDSRLIVAPDYYSSDIQQSIISNAEFVVGARYHSVVFALNNNIPLISLSYEHKISGLLATLGREDCMIDITNALDTEENINKTVAIFRQKLNTLQTDAQVTQNAKNIAFECFNKFVECIKQ